MAEQACTKTVERNHIGSDGDHMTGPHIGRAAAGGAVAHQQAGTVQNDECGFDKLRQIGNAFIDGLMQPVAGAAKQSIPVFHTQGHAAQVVRFDRWNADQLVGPCERPVKSLPFGNPQGADLNGFKQRRRRQPHLPAGGSHSLHQPGLNKTTFGVVDRVIDDTNLRTCRDALTHHLSNNGR